MPFDPLAFYGKNIIQDHHTSLKARLPFEACQSNSFDVSDDQLRFLPEKKVGILGAGVGGLYTALILDSLNIEYEILEASDRTGGRIFTYQFPGRGKYDYYVCCFVCRTYSSNSDDSSLPRTRVPRASHFRRRIAKDGIRMGS
jgi:hypothetical protein